MAGEARYHRDVGVDGVADRHTLALERLVVVVDPVARFRRVDEREGEGAHPELCGQADRLAVRAGDPQRRMRRLDGLGHHVAYRHREVSAAEAGVRVHHEHVGGLLDRLAPHRPPLRGIDAEALELRARRRFARAPLHAPGGDEIERGDAFGHARRMVVGRRHQHDAVPEPDALRALRGGGQEHLGRRGVRVLLQEVVLDFPRRVDAQAVGELHLVERVLEQAALAVGGPRPRQLMLVEDSEPHGAIPRNGGAL
jgi:hypothetical protein